MLSGWHSTATHTLYNSRALILYAPLGSIMTDAPVGLPLYSSAGSRQPANFSSVVIVNGEIVAQGSQFSLNDVGKLTSRSNTCLRTSAN